METSVSMPGGRAEAPGAPLPPGAEALQSWMSLGVAAASLFWGLQFWILNSVLHWVLMSPFRSGFLFFKEFNQWWARLHLKRYVAVLTKHRWDSTGVVNCWLAWHVEPIPMCWLHQEIEVTSSSTACLSWGCVASALVPTCQEPKALPETWISSEQAEEMSYSIGNLPQQPELLNYPPDMVFLGMLLCHLTPDCSLWCEDGGCLRQTMHLSLLRRKSWNDGHLYIARWVNTAGTGI